MKIILIISLLFSVSCYGQTMVTLKIVKTGYCTVVDQKKFQDCYDPPPVDYDGTLTLFQDTLKIYDNKKYNSIHLEYMFHLKDTEIVEYIPGSYVTRKAEWILTGINSTSTIDCIFRTDDSSTGTEFRIYFCRLDNKIGWYYICEPQ